VGAGNEAPRSSVGASFLSGFGFQLFSFVLARLPQCLPELSASRSFPFVYRRKRIGASYPCVFSRSCLQPPLLPGFYPHSQGATWARCTLGFDLKPGPCHNRDGARLVGCCHLIGDLRGSGHFPQSPEQGEWMSLLQTFPITNRPPRHPRVFYSLGSVFSRLRRLSFREHGWIRLYAAAACAVPVPAPERCSGS